MLQVTFRRAAADAAGKGLLRYSTSILPAAGLLAVLAAASMEMCDLAKVTVYLTKESDYAAYAALRGATPLGLIGNPDDIARWVEHLADPNERFVTGAVLAIDGGQTLNGWASAIAAAAGPAVD